MSDKLIIGDWLEGSIYQDPETKKTTDDRQNKARFFEHEIIDTAKSTKLNKVYSKIVKCDITNPNMKDKPSALVKENSDKHIELMQRFPNAWKNFISKGGGFGKKEVKPEAGNPVSEKKDISSEEEIELLKKEYEQLEDKRSNRGREIRAILKHLEG